MPGRGRGGIVTEPKSRLIILKEIIPASRLRQGEIDLIREKIVAVARLHLVGAGKEPVAVSRDGRRIAGWGVYLAKFFKLGILDSYSALPLFGPLKGCRLV